MCCLDSPRDTLIRFVALCLSTAEVIEVFQNTFPFSLSLPSRVIQKAQCIYPYVRVHEER